MGNSQDVTQEDKKFWGTSDHYDMPHERTMSIPDEMTMSLMMVISFILEPVAAKFLKSDMRYVEIRKRRGGDIMSIDDVQMPLNNKKKRSLSILMIEKHFVLENTGTTEKREKEE